MTLISREYEEPFAKSIYLFNKILDFLHIYIADFKNPERKSLVALELLKKSRALHNKSQKHQTTFCSIRDQQSHREPVTKSKHLTNLTNKQA